MHNCIPSTDDGDNEAEEEVYITVDGHIQRCCFFCEISKMKEILKDRVHFWAGTFRFPYTGKKGNRPCVLTLNRLLKDVSLKGVSRPKDAARPV